MIALHKKIFYLVKQKQIIYQKNICKEWVRGSDKLFQAS